MKLKRWAIMGVSFAFVTLGKQCATFLIIVTAVFTGTFPGAKEIFATMLYMENLDIACCYGVALGLFVIADVTVFFKRIENFLLTEEVVTKTLHPDIASTTEVHQKTQREEPLSAKGLTLNKDNLKTSFATESTPTLDTSSTKPIFFNLQNATFFPRLRDQHLGSYKTLDTPAIKNVSLSATDRSLIMITGPTGSGKSSVLNAILKHEISLDSGWIFSSGKVALVSQTPWLLPGTIREAILFGLPYDQSRYERVIEACELVKDFQLRAKGDMSSIGGRGDMISGGQRQRIALARAVYNNADIFLLDDPFSALDAKVAENIFVNYVQGLLRDRIVVLVTHQLSFLKHADHIVKMKGGEVEMEGEYSSMKDVLQDLVTESVEGDESISNRRKQALINEKVDDGEQYSHGGIIEDEEDRSYGLVSFKTFWEYFRTGMSKVSILCVILLFIVSQG